jgi:hypothetical protein
LCSRMAVVASRHSIVDPPKTEDARPTALIRSLQRKAP